MGAESKAKLYGVKLRKICSMNQGAFATLVPAMAPVSANPESSEAIGERIRLIRLAYGRLQGHQGELKQAEFAELCGISSRQLVNNVESGRERIGLDSAKLVYRRTGADLLFIYYGEIRALPMALGREIERLQQEKRSGSKKNRVS